MQTKPTNWDTILAGQHTVETAATVDGTEYGADKLVSIKTSGAIYDALSIGNATSRKLEIEYIPTVQPGRQATVSLKTRLYAPGITEARYANGTFINKTSYDGYVVCKFSDLNASVLIRGYADSTSYYIFSVYVPDSVEVGEEAAVSMYSVNRTTGAKSAITVISEWKSLTYYDEEYSTAETVLGSDYEIVYSNRTSYIPKGTFFISQRERTDYGTLKLTCYDAMLKAEADYPDPYSNFPKAPSAVLSTIVSTIGVTLDSRNVIDDTITVPMPVEDDGVLTMREVLQRIAVAQAGNFIISDAGKLRFIPFNSIPAETYYLTDENSNVLVWEDATKLVVGGVENS